MRIISASGRCGTSILAKILQECGCNLGNLPHPWADRLRAGMEDVDVWRVNKDIFSTFGKESRGFDYLTKVEIDIAVAKFGNSIRHLSLSKQFVKDVQFAKTLDVWIKAEAPIEYVVICMRDFSESAKSAIGTGAAILDTMRGLPIKDVEDEFFNRQNVLIKSVTDNKIPFYSVQYPDSFLKGLPELKDMFDINYSVLSETCRRLFKI